MNLPPGDADVTKLSGGEKRRVALCKILLEKPDLLLLDEPTNHLDAESVAWLERHLAEYPGTVVAVTHDRYFLDNVAEWILELDRGKGIPWEGNYSSWLEQKRKRLELEEKQAVGPAEARWPASWSGSASSPKARQAKSKARIAAYEKMAAEQFEDEPDELEIQIPPGKRLGELRGRGREPRQGLRRPRDLRERELPAAAGRHRGHHRPQRRRQDDAVPHAHGPGAARRGRAAHRRHGRAGLRRPVPRRPRSPTRPCTRKSPAGTTRSRWAAARSTRGPTSPGSTSRGTDQQKKVGILSGGERNRVHLAKLLRRGSNVLLLDEPTNDLDVDTLRALEEAVANFAGCAVVISHDRWFLDRLATHILAFEGDGYVHWCEGNFQTYEAQRRERLGVEADEPHRFRYKKLQQTVIASFSPRSADRGLTDHPGVNEQP